MMIGNKLTLLTYMALLLANASYVFAGIPVFRPVPEIPSLKPSQIKYDGLQIVLAYENPHRSEQTFYGKFNWPKPNSGVYVTCGDQRWKSKILLFYEDLMIKNQRGEISTEMKRLIAIPYVSFKVNVMTCYITSAECNDTLGDFEKSVVRTGQGQEALFYHMDEASKVQTRMRDFGWETQPEPSHVCLNLDDKGRHVFLFNVDPLILRHNTNSS
ncbi:hypothetical protein BDF19DRAFT_466583 [Syncephalis fuscata]|nr:hypothetical protein BDF19DRAFT_466583 [Syncephalis fuscata]